MRRYLVLSVLAVACSPGMSMDAGNGGGSAGGAAGGATAGGAGGSGGSGGGAEPDSGTSQDAGTDAGVAIVVDYGRLCRPCQQTSDCQTDAGDPATCVATTDDAGSTLGSFCTAPCGAGASCPSGYACSAGSCTPTSGECACADGWDDAGYVTACTRASTGIGTCTGTRSCSGAALTACTASTPLAETCNGLDDDCNGTVDDGQSALCPDDGLPCTVAACQGTSGCTTTLVAGTCAIDGGCFDAGALNPASSCQLCNPALTTSAFSVNPQSCTVNGTCLLAGATMDAGTCRVCDPSNNTALLTTRAGTCFIGGSCFASTEANPANACEQCLPCDADGGAPAGASCSTLLAQLNSKSQFTPAPVTVQCGVADTCHAVGSCSGTGTCTQPVRQDSNEANETYSAATSIGSANECDDQARSGSGILSGSTDSDWFRITFNEQTTACVPDPQLSVGSSGVPVTACAYYRCTTGNNQPITCSDGSAVSTTLNGAGYLGCCKTGINPTFRHEHDCEQCGGPFGCTGDDDSADVRLSVSGLTTPPVCAPYSFSIKF